MTASTRDEEGKGTEPVLYMAFELSDQWWKLGFTTDLGRQPRHRSVQARDLERLEEVIEEARSHFGVDGARRVISCYEAGRDGFWLDRWLRAQGIENHVIDSSSIQVDRRARRRKSDQLDVRALLRQLVRYGMGDEDAWSVVNVPSRESEDRRQLHREIEVLTNERTERTNRIRSLLLTHGIKMPVGTDFPERLREVRLWDGAPLPPDLQARLRREWVRWSSVVEEIDALEVERERRLEECSEDPVLEKVRQLMMLKGVGRKSAWLFVMEFFGWRDFNNGKEVGRLAGLAPTPYDSGEAEKTPGIEKAGNRRVRRMAIEIAWNWIRYQPKSKITRWFKRRFAPAGKRARRRGIVGVARKLLVAQWRFLETGEIPKGAVLNGA